MYVLKFNKTSCFIIYIVIHLFFYSHGYAQTFTNNTSAAANSWNISLTRTISVSGLPSSLSASLELIQVNIHLGNQADGTYNFSLYTITLQSPAGTTITLKPSGIWGTSMKEVNIKLRSDNGYLQYPPGSTYEPYHIGYYKIQTGSSFSGSFNGENPNGNWTLTITETSVSSGTSFNKVDLVFAPVLLINNITASTINDSCKNASCLGNDKITIGTNNGYNNPGDASTDPPLATTPACSWNSALNNSAWFSFIADSISAHITLSAITNSLQILGIKTIGTACSQADWRVLTGGCPDDLSNDTYKAPQYSNGSSGNMQLIISGLTIGETYYFVVDGNGGAISPFYLEIDGATSCCVPPAVSTTITDVTCSGSCDGIVTVTASGGTTPYTYKWSNGPTTATVNGLCAGNYTVTINDANSCETSSSAAVNQPSSILMTTSKTDATCGNANGSASVTATGGTPPFTYKWSTGGSTQIITNLTSGSYLITTIDAVGCRKDTTVNISDSNGPIAGVSSQKNISCNGKSDGNVKVTVTGGTAPYTFSWTNGSTSDSISNVVAGNYTLTVIDASNCKTFVTATINEPSVQMSFIISEQIKCYGLCDGTATVFATGGTSPYTYKWNTGATTTGISNLCPGVYELTTEDANKCTTITSVTITEPSEIAIVAGKTDANCGSSNGTASVTVSGGTPTYKYSWSTADSTPSITGLSADIYNLTVMDANNCIKNTTVTINNTGAPSATIIDSGYVKCKNGNDGYAEASVTGGTTPYTYLWTPGGSTGKIATGLSANTYTLEVTDSNGCKSSIQFVISEPSLISIATSSTDITSCYGASEGTAIVSASGGTPVYSYKWSNGVTSSEIINLKAGVYFVTVTDANGCSINNTITIFEPLQLIANAGTDSSICQEDSVSIGGTPAASGGTGAYTYQWLPATYLTSITNSNPTAFPITTTTYSITVSDANNCKASDSVIIFILPKPIADAGNDTIICLGDSVTLTASGGQTCTWLTTNGINNVDICDPAVSPDSTTLYIVQVQDERCKAFDTVMVTVNSVNAGFVLSDTIGQTPLSISFINTSSGVLNYQWYFGDNDSSAATNPVKIYELEGNYTVTLIATDSMGCRDTSIYSYIKVTTEMIIPNVFTPWPASPGYNDVFYIKGLPENSFLIVFNRWGQLVYKSDINGYQNNWDGFEVTPDVYFYILSNESLGKDWHGTVQVIQ